MDFQKEPKKRLEFVIVLSLFFPVVIQSLFQHVSEDIIGSEQILKFSAVIATLLLVYLLLEFLKNIPTWAIKITNILLLLQIACFAAVLMILSVSIDVIHYPFTLIFPAALLLTWYIPPVVFGVLILSFPIRYFLNSKI